MSYLTYMVHQAMQKNIQMLPCSEEEIQKVQDFAGNKLPGAYVEFLKTMGRGTPNGFLRGHSCFINELFNLNTWSNELLEEENFPVKLKEDDFVFWMSQGYLFAFFNLREGEDPPVYFYRERSDQKNFVRIAERFSDFLLGLLNNDMSA